MFGASGTYPPGDQVQQVAAEVHLYQSIAGVPELQQTLCRVRNEFREVEDVDSDRRRFSYSVETIVDRAFPFAAVRVWNDMRSVVTSASTIPTLKRLKKTETDNCYTSFSIS